MGNNSFSLFGQQFKGHIIIIIIFDLVKVDNFVFYLSFYTLTSPYSLPLAIGRNQILFFFSYLYSDVTRRHTASITRSRIVHSWNADTLMCETVWAQCSDAPTGSSPALGRTHLLATQPFDERK